MEFQVKFLGGTGRRPSDLHGSNRGGERFYSTVGDLVLAGSEIYEALDRAPNHRVRWAAYYERYGAWVADRNKTSTHRILPFGRYLRETVDEWLACHPAADVAAAPLLPSIKDPMKPLAPNLAYKWLCQAEEHARSDAIRMGLNVEEIVPKRPGSVWHGLRPMWRTLMTRLGWDLGADEGLAEQLKVPALNKHALYYGGWTLGVGAVQAHIYSRLLPEYLLAVAEMIPAVKVMAQQSVHTEKQVREIFGPPGLERYSEVRDGSVIQLDVS